jgi:hypothetical protein
VLDKALLKKKKKKITNEGEFSIRIVKDILGFVNSKLFLLMQLLCG